MTDKTAYALLERVAEAYQGPRYSFIRARLSLQTGIDLAELRPEDHDAETVEKLEVAIREICPDVDL